jgi:DNA-binding NarL/FixJ family response regulator
LAQSQGLQEVEVLIVEDHLAVRKGLELLLRDHGMRIAGVAADVREARGLIERRRFDVALVDVALGEGSGIELVRELHADRPDARTVLYTGTSDPSLLEEAANAGAEGFVLKSAPPAELISAIETVAGGGAYVDTSLASVLASGVSSAEVADLSGREREILDLLADGLTGEEAAEQLHLSPETVRTHVRNAMNKLGARTRVHAVALAIRARQLNS